MKLTELIKPFDRNPSLGLGCSTSKNLLELILRTSDDPESVRNHLPVNYDMSKVEKYRDLVTNLSDKLTDQLGYEDFSWIVLNPRTTIGSFVICFKETGSFFLAKTIPGDNEDAMFLLSRIRKWQAEYHLISEFIRDLGEKAETYGTPEELAVIFREDTGDVCSCCDAPNSESGSDSELETRPVQSVQNVPDTVTAPATAPTNNLEAQVPQLSTQEAYEQLFSRRATILFPTDSYVHNARVSRIQGNVMTVEINGNTTVDLLSDIPYQLLTPASKSDRMDPSMLERVKSVPISGAGKDFAYPGFKLDGKLYKIANMPYPTMYSYIIQEGNDLSLIPKDLVDVAMKIRQEVAVLPEITDFCTEATVKIGVWGIDITHAGDTTRTYAEGLVDSSPYEVYTRMRRLAGRVDGKLYLFLCMGTQKYKIAEISDAYAAEVLIASKN